MHKANITFQLRTALAAAGFLATIVVANILSSHFGLVSIGFGLAVSAGTFAAGAALVARDFVQDAARRRAVVALIVLGAALSFLLGNGRIALASGIAFLLSELVDMAVYTPLRERSQIMAVIASTVVAAPIDTVLFLSISGFGVTGGSVVGQWLVKISVGLIAVALLGGARALRREPQHA